MAVGSFRYLLLACGVANLAVASLPPPTRPAPPALLRVARNILDGGGSPGEAIAAAAGAAGREVVRQDTNGDKGFFVKPIVDKDPASVLVIHGLDGNGQEWGYIALMVSYLSLNYVRFVLPTAPNRAVNYLGRKANSWYDMTLVKTRRYTWKVIDDFVVCDPEQMAESVARIEKLLAIEEAAGVPPRRIFLLGFSQGGALATTVFLRTQRALGGMMGISTWMPFQQAYSINGVRGTRKSDVRFQHGEDDKAVNLTWVQSSVKRLRALGYNAELATFKGQGHALVSNDVVLNIENFVQDRAPGEVQVLFKLLDDVTKRFTDASRQINNAMPQALSAGVRALRARRRTAVAGGSGVAQAELN